MPLSALMSPKKITRSNTMASQDGPNHDNSELSSVSKLSEENERPPQEEFAAAGKGSEQKGSSFVTQDVIAMLKNELSRNQENWKYVPQPPYPSSLLQQPYAKGYEAPSLVFFYGRKGSPKENVNRFIDVLGPHADLASRFCKKYFQHEERVTTTQLNSTCQKHVEVPVDFMRRFRDLALDCYDDKDNEALVEICISNIVADYKVFGEY
ncbi:unnamed protein product [Prunus armeniaca]